MNHSTPATSPNNRYFTDDPLFGNDPSFDGPAESADGAEAIRARTSMVNGGEVAMYPCRKCGGSGQTRWGRCFQCQGKGKRSKASLAASKGNQTRKANAEMWQEEHATEIAYMHKRAGKGSNFYQSFVEKLQSFGALTENQLTLVQRDMAKDAEFYAAKKKEREATVDVSAIWALFDKAGEKLAKSPIFRTEKLTISKAPMTGRNPGALYVKDSEDGTFYGMVKGNTFEARREATPEVYSCLQAVATDPAAEAIAYARKFKRCFSCGRTLRAPVSVGAVVGPICAEKWGFEYLRLQAAEILAEEAAAEEAAK